MLKNEISKIIKEGRTYLGIELGSTRIKAVLSDENGTSLASGSFTWENQLENGIWTYRLDDAVNGVRQCYADLCADVKSKYGICLTALGSIGISAMMHGYLPFDANGNQLVPFRTWRNTITGEAAAVLSDLFKFNVPERWSIAHLYQAILNGEAHVSKISSITTLSGYIHRILTGENILGVGDASGMFPIDSATGNYDAVMVEKFDALLKENKLDYSILDILPKVKFAGECAGTLTAEGAALLDESGNLQAGALFCPPEGDAETGMVATNSIAPKTGNVSAGTSIFAMAVMEKPLKNYYSAIDIVTTPDGRGVAMVHCNNCCSDIDAWAGIFDEFSALTGNKLDKGQLFGAIYGAAQSGESDCGGIVSCNYLSGESLTDIRRGVPMVARRDDAKLTLGNFMRSQLYSAVATLRIGMDILYEKEDLKLDKMSAHGGYVKAQAGRKAMAAALNLPITVYYNSGEGGAWGMSILAAYAACGKGMSLEEYLNTKVFADAKSEITYADAAESEGFMKWMEQYRTLLNVERAAVDEFYPVPSKESAIKSLKERVYKANMDLVRNGLVVLTWGNVSGIDRESGLVAIKPSGVDYDKLTPDDIVVLNLDGQVVEGSLRPSSDTPTHLELYRTFPNIGGIVHTHSINATAFAQAGKPITPFGTTHADCFFGDVPCTRELSAEEIANDYEKNTGVVIAETFKGRDEMAVPAVLVKNHAPFTWGASPEKAVEVAVTLESAAEMALKTLLINQETQRVSQNLLDKHYFRKHGSNAYYGQK